MADRHTVDQRSRNMSCVKNRNTSVEMKVRQLLHSMGYRFRVTKRELPGSPDIVLPKYRTVIFVHGCFWHGHEGCPRANRPASNSNFWSMKLDRNIARDASVVAKLRGMGWSVLVIWECETKDIVALCTTLEGIRANVGVNRDG